MTSIFDVNPAHINVLDAGASAKTLARPGLQGAPEALREGKADAILVVKLDRLTRSVHDLGLLLDEYFTDPSLSAKEHAHDVDLGNGVLACAFALLDEPAGPCRSPLQGLLAFGEARWVEVSTGREGGGAREARWARARGAPVRTLRGARRRRC